MKNSSILIIDKDPKNQKVLENNFADSGYKVELAGTNTVAMQLIQTKPFDVVLTELSTTGIDGYSLLEAIHKLKLNKEIPVVVISQKNDIWNRVKCLKNGAKDYIVKPIHIRELVARVNMLLSRIERKSAEASILKKKFSGKLQDINLFDLVKVFGIEKKTGILTLLNENGFTGQIFFEDGNIISANTLSLKGEEAVFKMMTWNKGRFSMHFCDIDVIDETRVSNLAILLQGAMRMEQRENLLKKLPSLEVVITTTPNFNKIISKHDLNSDLQYFLELFDGKRTLGEIIQASKDDEIKTLKKILQLNQLGFLNIVKEKPSVAEPKIPVTDTGNAEPVTGENNTQSFFEDIIKEQDVESLQAKVTDFYQPPPVNKPKPVIPRPQPKESSTIVVKPPVVKIQTLPPKPTPPAATVFPNAVTKTQPQGAPQKQSAAGEKFQTDIFYKAKGNILVLGTDQSPRKKIVDCLISNKPVESQVAVANVSEVYFGTARFTGEHYLNITTFSMEKEFTPLLDYFVPTTLGYILLVECKAANWSYYQYLLNVLRSKLNVPALIVIINKTTGPDVPGIDEIRAKLALKKNEKIMMCSQFDKNASRRLIFSLFKDYYKKQA
ncbi:MAG TPA: response regulator [bacterium]|nr:response regulator [bacterium]HPN44301.1 response regulator [bacterium]